MYKSHGASSMTVRIPRLQPCGVRQDVQNTGGFGDTAQDFIEMLEERKHHITDATSFFVEYEMSASDDPEFCKMLKEVRAHFEKIKNE